MAYKNVSSLPKHGDYCWYSNIFYSKQSMSKVYMTEKKRCLFERPFRIQKNGLFLNIFFRFRDIDVFLLCKLGQ